MPTNPIAKDKKTQVVIDRASLKYQRSYMRYLNAGVPPESAARRALKESGFVEVVTNGTAEGIAAAFATGGADVGVSFVRKTWLNKTFEGATIKSRILKNADNGSKMVSSITRQSMRAAESWTKLAQSITDADLLTGDISKQVSELSSIAKSALNDHAAAKEYAKTLERTERYVSQLAQNGAPTTRLKAAYQSVINATKKGSQAAIDNAIERAVQAKMNYNAQRIARTERARAWGNATSNDFLNDADVVAYQWALSSRHEIEDICDLHANADLYGLGKGIYPKDKGPEYPAHPHCLCLLNAIYRGEVDPVDATFDSAGGDEYLEKQSQHKQNQLLGIKGADEWRNGASWESVAKNYTGQTTKKVIAAIEK